MANEPHGGMTTFSPNPTLEVLNDLSKVTPERESSLEKFDWLAEEFLASRDLHTALTLLTPYSKIPLINGTTISGNDIRAMANGHVGGSYNKKLSEMIRDKNFNLVNSGNIHWIIGDMGLADIVGVKGSAVHIAELILGAIVKLHNIPDNEQETVNEAPPEQLTIGHTPKNDTTQEENILNQPLPDFSGITHSFNAEEQMAADDRRRAFEKLTNNNRVPLNEKEAAVLYSTNHRRDTAPHTPKTSALRSFVNRVKKEAKKLTQGKKEQLPTDQELANSIHVMGQSSGEGSYLGHVSVPGKLSHQRNGMFTETVPDFSDSPMPNLSNVLLPDEVVRGEDFSNINGPRENSEGDLPAMRTNHPFGSNRLRADDRLHRGQSRKGDDVAAVDSNTERRAKNSTHSHIVLASDTPDTQPLAEIKDGDFTETLPSTPNFERTQPGITFPDSSSLLFFDKNNPDTLSLGETTIPDIPEERRGELRENKKNSPDTIPGILPSDVSPHPSELAEDQSYKISAPRNTSVKRGLFSSIGNRIARLIGKKKVTQEENDKRAKDWQASEIMDSEFDEVKTLEKASKAIEALNRGTEERRKTLLEQVGNGVRKHILERIENIGDKFNKIPLKYRLGIGLGIAGLGAMGMPFTWPTLTLISVYRLLAGASSYALLHKGLEKGYEVIESRGGKVNFLTKGALEMTALGISTFGMYYLSEFIGSHFSGGHGAVTPTSVPTPDIVTPTPTDVAPVVTPAPDIVTPNATTAVIVQAVTPSSFHTILPNERLWDIVKNHLLESDAFKALSEEARKIEISKYIAYIAQEKILPNVNLIHAGDVFDFSQVDGKVPADILKHVNPFSH